MVRSARRVLLISLLASYGAQCETGFHTRRASAVGVVASRVTRRRDARHGRDAAETRESVALGAALARERDGAAGRDRARRDDAT